MSLGACSLNTDKRSRKSSNVRLPLLSLENTRQILCLNGFSCKQTNLSITDISQTQNWTSVCQQWEMGIAHTRYNSGMRTTHWIAKCLWDLYMFVPCPQFMAQMVGIWWKIIMAKWKGVVLLLEVCVVAKSSS